MPRIAQHWLKLIWIVGSWLVRQVETVSADKAEVVRQYVAIKLVSELSAKRTATNSAGKAAEDGARYGADSDAKRAGNYTDSCADLAASQCTARTASDTYNRANSGSDFHGCSEGGDLGRVTARALH
jgi:hypothetical protein